MSPIENITEKNLVNNLLFGAISQSSERVDSFSWWLLAGYSAITAFILGNPAVAADHLTKSMLHCFLSGFILVLVLGIFEKFLAILIGAASAGAAVGREITIQLQPGTELMFSVIFTEVERAIFPPMRWLVQRSFRKAAEGDITAASRNFTRLAQIQGICVALQALTVLWVVVAVTCRSTF